MNQRRTTVVKVRSNHLNHLEPDRWLCFEASLPPWLQRYPKAKCFHSSGSGSHGLHTHSGWPLVTSHHRRLCLSAENGASARLVQRSDGWLWRCLVCMCSIIQLSCAEVRLCSSKGVQVRPPAAELVRFVRSSRLFCLRCCWRSTARIGSGFCGDGSCSWSRL